MCAYVWGRHRALALGLAALSWLGLPSAVLASPGCDAVQSGAFNLFVPAGDGVASTPAYAFAAGDTLTFQIARVTSPGSDGAYLSLYDAGNPAIPLLHAPGDAPSETASFVVPPPDKQLYLTLGSYGSSIGVVVSCSSGNGSTGTSDSDKLRSVQVQGTRIVAQTSGAAISGAVDQAVGAALDGGSSSGTGGGGVTGTAPSNLGGPSPGERSNLGMGPSTAALYRGHRSGNWNAWLQLRYSQTERGDASTGFDGTQFNGTFGIDRRVASGVVVGVLGGFERFGYDFASLTGHLRGNGATGGAYLGWRLAPALRFDALAAYSRIDYSATAGTAAGSFEGNRWVLSAGLTGTQKLGAFTVEHSARLHGVWERQASYVDSLGTAQNDNAFHVGRASFGTRVSHLWQWAPGFNVSPYAGLYADWRFSSEAVVPAGTDVLSFRDGWSARAVGGLGLLLSEDAAITVGGEWAGLGTDTRQRALTVRGSLRF